jgi:hypothetical protein
VSDGVDIYLPIVTKRFYLDYLVFYTLLLDHIAKNQVPVVTKSLAHVVLDISLLTPSSHVGHGSHA